ncbi:uncharacterized protein LOC107495679 [Arachis duranensis]|uniref:Uncharacterized protein LOC107495679 n=1 Tax=Arachis duranensis TaxID=130453 RepID=A0A6P4E1J2_ARADU|nr:uncharacterized protein LOC107495679 [Arachis duranensis]
MECVGTISMSVLINGSPTKLFRMERGPKQGDPLSLFLFVLVVDVLHRMIGEVVRNMRITPLLVERDNIELSHLQFADDNVLFCPPEEESIKNYKRLLRCYELMSGLSINFDKSSLIPINCEHQWVRNMCSLLGCKEATLPFRLRSLTAVPSAFYGSSVCVLSWQFHLRLFVTVPSAFRLYFLVTVLFVFLFDSSVCASFRLAAVPSALLSD